MIGTFPNGAGTIEICCRATNGCDSTNEVCKTFQVLLPPNRDTTVHICNEDNTWPGTGVPDAPSPLPGAPFAPGFHTVNLRNAETCPYNFNIVVIKDAPVTKDLGDQLVCATETFTYCGQTYTALQGGPKTFICNGLAEILSAKIQFLNEYMGLLPPPQYKIEQLKMYRWFVSHLDFCNKESRRLTVVLISPR